MRSRPRTRTACGPPDPARLASPAWPASLARQPYLARLPVPPHPRLVVFPAVLVVPSAAPARSRRSGHDHSWRQAAGGAGSAAAADEHGVVGADDHVAAAVDDLGRVDDAGAGPRHELLPDGVGLRVGNLNRAVQAAAAGPLEVDRCRLGPHLVFAAELAGQEGTVEDVGRGEERAAERGAVGVGRPRGHAHAELTAGPVRSDLANPDPRAHQGRVEGGEHGEGPWARGVTVEHRPGHHRSLTYSRVRSAPWATELPAPA